MIHNKEFQKSNSKFSHVFWAYTGAFLFAVILIVLIHETGHYLAFRWHGYDASVRINPFMGKTSCQQEVQSQDLIYIFFSGPVFQLLIAAAVAILLRFARNTNWILLKMYAAMAFLVEGMVLINGLFFDEVVTDFSWLIYFGLHPMLVAALGILLIMIGGFLNYEVWNLVGITSETPRMQIFLLNSPFLIYGLVGFVMGFAILPIELKFFGYFLGLAVLLHSIYLALRVALNPFIMPLFQRRKRDESLPITAKIGKFSMVLGCTSWIVSFLVLN